MGSMVWNSTGLPTAWIIGSSTLLFLVLIYFEYRRPGEKRFGLRLILLLFMVGALALLALKPAVEMVRKSINAVFLTQDFDPSALDSLQKGSEDLLFVFSEKDLITAEKVIPVADIDQLAFQYPEIDMLYILGNGLAHKGALDSYPFRMVPLLNTLPTGILDIEFPPEILIGEEVNIEGIVKKKAGEALALILEGPEGNIDSLTVKEEISAFTFTHRPKVAGRHTYYLIEKDSIKKSKRKTIVPIVVNPAKPLNIAIRTEAPTFEVRFLKNWLGELRHNLVVKSQISKEIFRDERINNPPYPVVEISANGLKDMDLLIMEGVAFSRLRNRELEALKNAITNQGLGLLILADEVVMNQILSQRLSSFLNFNFQQKRTGEALIEADSAGRSHSFSISTLPFKINADLGVSSFYDGLYAFRNRGLGKIGLTMALDTYQMQLEGKQQLYTLFWSALIKKMLPITSKEPAWDIEKELAFIYKPIEINLLGFSDIPLGTIADPKESKDHFYMRQDVNFPKGWKGKYWPGTTGWHKVTLSSDSTIAKWFYVHPEGTWQSYQHHLQIKETKHFITRLNAVQRKKPPVYAYHKISGIYFFAIFLLSCGLLWLEQKL